MHSICRLASRAHRLPPPVGACVGAVINAWSRSAAAVPAVSRAHAGLLIPLSARTAAPCRCMSVSGLPNLPGPSGAPDSAPPPLPSPLGPRDDPLPPPGALPSPLDERHLPPLSPRGAGIDSPRSRENDEGPSSGLPGGVGGGGGGGGGSGGSGGDGTGGRGGPSGGGDSGAPGAPGEGANDSEQLGPRTSMPPRGGIEQGLGGPPLPNPRTVPEQELHEPGGPGRTSDTPPLPKEPRTPQDPPMVAREKQEQEQYQRKKQARQVAEAGGSDQRQPDVWDAVLPPPPGSDLERALREAGRRAKWHRTGPEDSRGGSAGGGGGGGLWARLKALLKR